MEKLLLLTVLSVLGVIVGMVESTVVLSPFPGSAVFLSAAEETSDEIAELVLLETVESTTVETILLEVVIFPLVCFSVASFRSVPVTLEETVLLVTDESIAAELAILVEDNREEVGVFSE